MTANCLASSKREAETPTHWMIFVRWSTIVDWKRRLRGDSAESGVHPYQYSSDNRRFLLIKPGDVLWLISTPRFGAKGERTLHDRARPPAVMARLRVAKLCCNRNHEDCRIKKGKQPVCLGTGIPCCCEPGVLDEGVHAASDAWSIVAVGEKDPKNPEPLQVTYPVLYNFFGALRHLKFKTKQGKKNLKRYLAFVESGQYFSRAQLERKRNRERVRNPGPYAPLGQIFRTLRKLTPEAAAAMDAVHDRAVQGKRVFFSYKWADVEHFAAEVGQTRREWIRELNRRLDEAGYGSWLDHHQIFANEDMGELLDEILADAVHQSVVFVALLSKRYGTGCTLKEWKSARAQLENEERKSRMLPIVLNCGGDPARLGLTEGHTLPIVPSPTPRDVVQAITLEVARPIASYWLPTATAP